MKDFNALSGCAEWDQVTGKSYFLYSGDTTKVNWASGKYTSEWLDPPPKKTPKNPNPPKKPQPKPKIKKQKSTVYTHCCIGNAWILYIIVDF